MDNLIACFRLVAELNPKRCIINSKAYIETFLKEMCEIICINILDCILQFVIILLLVFITEVVVVVLGYIYRAKVITSQFQKCFVVNCDQNTEV